MVHGCKDKPNAFTQCKRIEKIAFPNKFLVFVFLVFLHQNARQHSHPLTQRVRRLHHQVLAIRQDLALQLTIDHQVHRRPAAFLAQTLQLLQRMDRQRPQIILRPAVALDHDVLHPPRRQDASHPRYRRNNG